jgi:predicted amidophosphoribosyltransferase
MGKKKFVAGDYDFRLYVGCPDCGSKASRSEATDGADIICPKCGAKLKFTINDQTVTTELLTPSKRRLAAMRQYKMKLSSILKTSK